MCVCICVYTHMYIHTYVFIFIYIYAYVNWKPQENLQKSSSEAYLFLFCFAQGTWSQAKHMYEYIYDRVPYMQVLIQYVLGNTHNDISRILNVYAYEPCTLKTWRQIYFARKTCLRKEREPCTFLVMLYFLSSLTLCILYFLTPTRWFSM